MIVNQIKKIKQNKKSFVLYINDNQYVIDSYYYECILPYVGKVFEVDEMLELIAFSNANSVIEKLYSKIFNHAISKYEVKQKLKNNNISDDNITLIINRLIKEQHLNEEDFVNHHMEIYQYKKGKEAFRRFLESKYISKRNIDKAMETFIENEEYVLEYSLKFISSKVSSNAMLKQKLFVSLLNKGFSKELINKTINKLSFEKEEDNLVKEVKKYLKKYPNDEYKVISKLASKGYNVSMIKKAIRKEGLSIED